MSFLGSLTGDSQSTAARQAAQDTYSKQVAQVAALQGAGNEYNQRLTGLYSPFAAAGNAGYNTSNDQLMKLIQNPSSVSSLPGYQFDLTQGLQGLDRAAAAHSMLNSGANQKATLRYATGLADKTYGDQLSRLMGLNQQYSALGLAGTGGQAAGAQGALNANTQAANLGFQSAGTQGQGMIAGAQAQSDALGNLLKLAGYVGGAALGGPIGSSIGSSLFGGSLGSGSSNPGWSAPLSAGSFLPQR